jgi:thiamine-monophosphate kinase
MTSNLSSPTVSSAGEAALIDRIRRRATVSSAWVTLGIGDDAAVLEPARGALDVLTTDALVEGVHFRRDWTPPRAIGHKALAVNLSDLAAMGATPRAALLNLALPAELPLRDFDELVDGFLTLADAVKMPLVGGNLTRSPGPLMLDVTAVGTAHRRRLLTRSGGRPGDELFLTGSIGAAAAGMRLLADSARRDDLGPVDRECVSRYERPDAQLECGIQIGRNRGASACVDLSDGLGDAARQIAAASHTGVVIEAGLVPLHAGAVAWAERHHLDSLEFSMAGGEDYELLFAIRPRQRRGFLSVAGRCRAAVTRIGRLTTEPGAWLERSGRLEPLVQGFSHF